MARGPRLVANDQLLKHRADEVRKQIQATKLLQRVQKIAAGEITIEPAMLAVQLRAAEILLRKTLPDLSQVDMNANVDGSLTITIKKLA